MSTVIRTHGLILASVLSLGALGAHAETLSLSDFQSTSHIVSVEGTTRWMDAVEKATDGKITFSHFPAEQAAKAKAQLGAVKSGVLDAALLGPSYNTESLPLNSVVDLPGYYDSAVEGTKAVQSMLTSGPLREEFLAAGVTPIYGFVLPPYQVLSRQRLSSLDNWKSIDVRTSGGVQAMTARGLGAVGISIPGPEVYTAVETGRLDAILFPLASVPGYKLDEVVTHISTNGSFGGYSFVMVVRNDLFDGLAPEIQQTMITVGEEVALHVAKAQDDTVSHLIAAWREKGIDTYSFTEEELVELRSAMAQVTDDWAGRMGGEKAQSVLDTYKQLTGE
jgi:TRAP-type C4-dicarboxylate transport system substrate-binding protein